jgi:hypothetical protein
LARDELMNAFGCVIATSIIVPVLLSDDLSRTAYVRTGRNLELLTILWNSLEAIIAIVAGVAAGSVALVGFGLDSVIEVSSGVALLWRLLLDAGCIPPREIRNDGPEDRGSLVPRTGCLCRI